MGALTAEQKLHTYETRSEHLRVGDLIYSSYDDILLLVVHLAPVPFKRVEISFLSSDGRMEPATSSYNERWERIHTPEQELRPKDLPGGPWPPDEP